MESQPRCPFHKYTASSCGLVSFPRRRESRRPAPWGLDARLRGHDVLLVPDLRNRHLVFYGDDSLGHMCGHSMGKGAEQRACQ
jgi:hypothetical protein